MVGNRVVGPSPFLDASNNAIRQSVPVRKWEPEASHCIEDGVRYASVVGEIRGYVETGLGGE